MCNLYSSTLPPEAMRGLFAVNKDHDLTGNAQPLDAIFPKYDAPIVRTSDAGNRELINLSWGFRTTNKSKKTGNIIAPQAWNNARDDNLHSGLWRASYESRRCLIPATSFCESLGRNPATYYWFGVLGPESRPPFACAGMWQTSHYDTKEGSRQTDTFTMITTNANELVRPYHAKQRMPVILHPDDYPTWLEGTPEIARSLLRPFPEDDMQIHQSGEGLRADPK